MDFRAVQRTGGSLCRPLRGRGLWRRNVAEHKLCQFFLLAVAPVLENVRHALIDLGGFLVGEHGIDDALVKPQLASVRGDFEHIVHIRADRTAVYLGRSFREGFHHVLLDLRGFGGDGVVRNLRRGQVELIRRFDVGDLFEQIHQFGQVEKLCKARPCPVAGSLRGKLQRGGGFTKAACPAIEVAHTHLSQPVMLQIALDGVKLRHGVGNRGAGGKHHAAPAGQLIHVAALGEHIRGFLRIGGGKPCHVAHLRIEEKIFIIVRLVHKHPVYAELFKVNHIILAVAGLQLFQPRLQPLFRALQALDGKAVAACELGILNAIGDFLNLLMKEPFLPLRTDGDTLKLAVADDNSVIVAGGDTGAEFLAVVGFKVLLGSDKDVGRRVEPQKLRRPLFRQMVRHDKNGFLAQSQPLRFHRRGYHFKGFSRANFVCQQRIPAVQHMGDGVFLMLSEGDFRVHPRENDVAAVILAGTSAVHFLVVLPYQRFAPLRVFPNPVLERIPDKLLLLRGKGGFLGVEDTALPSVCVLNGIVDANIAEVQRILQQPVGAGAVCAVGGERRHIVVAHHALAGNLPFCGVRDIADLDLSAQIAGRFKGFVHELLDVLLIKPCRTQPHLNLTGFKVFRLGSNQGVHIPSEEWVARCHALRGTELLPDVAGEIFVRRLPALCPMLAAVLQVKWATVGFLVNDALQILNDLWNLFAAAHEGGHKVEIDAGFFSDADSKGFAGGIHRIYAALLLDGALVEHIRLALQLSVVVQHFQ